MNGLTRVVGAVFSGIVAATPRIAKRFPPEKTALVQNFPRGEVAANDAVDDYSTRRKAVLYLGSITMIRGIVQMVEAFARPVIPIGARLVIAGSFGIYSDPALERTVRSSDGWRRVDFLGWRSPADVGRLLQTVRVGLVLFHPNKAHLEAQPTKLFEYMRAGIPVIVSDFPLWQDIVKGADCGIVVDPLDCDAIAAAIASLLNDPKRAEEMGRHGQEAVRTRYCWAKEADRLIDLYEGLFYPINQIAAQNA
jgi:glycosyltransferase involved in cell wall biosynthesis